jgi:hypothetical protein
VNESIGKGPGRQKATDEMRSRASRLEDEARRWRNLADRLDEIERYAATESAPSEGEGTVPYIGVGSSAEVFLWMLATRPLT